MVFSPRTYIDCVDVRADRPDPGRAAPGRMSRAAASVALSCLLFASQGVVAAPWGVSVAFADEAVEASDASDVGEVGVGSSATDSVEVPITETVVEGSVTETVSETDDCVCPEELLHPEKRATATVRREVSDDDGSTWSTDVDAPSFGDVSYRVTGTLPETLPEGGADYRYTFVDRLEATIGYDVSTMRVILRNEGVEDRDVTEAFTPTVTEDGLFLVGCDDLLDKVEGINSDSELVLIYDAKLVAEPGIGLLDPNDSSSAIEYGTEVCMKRTVEDQVTVHSWRLEVHKLGSRLFKESDLAGATFVLADHDGLWLSKDGWSSDEKERAAVKSDDKGLAYLGIVGTGVYALREIEPPVGYESVDDTKVSLERKADTLTVTAKGAGTIESVDANTGVIRVRVVDNAKVLPEPEPEPEPEPTPRPLPEPNPKPTPTPIRSYVTRMGEPYGTCRTYKWCEDEQPKTVEKVVTETKTVTPTPTPTPTPAVAPTATTGTPTATQPTTVVSGGGGTTTRYVTETPGSTAVLRGFTPLSKTGDATTWGSAIGASLGGIALVVRGLLSRRRKDD